MKKLTVLVMVLHCCVISMSYAQVKVGIRAGLNASSTVGGETGPNKAFLLGIHTGPFARLKLNEKFFVQPEILFSMKGVSFKISDAIGGPLKMTTRLHYIDCPILFGYKPGNRFGFLIGVQPSYLLSSKSTATQQGSDISTKNPLGLKKIDLGVVGGVQYETDFGLDFGARICYGVLEMSNSGVHNLNFMATIGYAFGK